MQVGDDDGRDHFGDGDNDGNDHADSDDDHHADDDGYDGGGECR